MSERPAPAAPTGRQGWIAWLERRINLTELFSLFSHFGLVYTPVDTSRPLREALRDVAAQPVPTFARWPRLLGLVAAVFFGLQALSGLLLAHYYRATPEAAFASTRLIARDLPFGWFIHQMHSWGALLLIVILIARLARLYWQGLFRAPREVLWLSAAAMVGVVALLDFTGRLLPWDHEGYWSVVRGLEVLGGMPVLGGMLTFSLGGQVVNADLLTRSYVMHVLILPAVLAGLLYVTFATLRRVGLSPESGEAKGGSTSFREHMYAVTILQVLAFGLLVSVAVLVPFRFVAEADPYSTPGGVRPPWYLLAPYFVLERLPGFAAGWVALLLALALLFGPFLFRGSDARASLGRARLWGIVLVVVWIALTAAGVFLDRAS